MLIDTVSDAPLSAPLQCGFEDAFRPEAVDADRRCLLTSHSRCGDLRGGGTRAGHRPQPPIAPKPVLGHYGYADHVDPVVATCLILVLAMIAFVSDRIAVAVLYVPLILHF